MSTSGLSRSLTDTAAEADWQAHNAAVLRVVGRRGTLDEKRREISRARSRAAVAAVLETLAAHYEGPGSLMGAGSLRRLAAEVRAGCAVVDVVPCVSGCEEGEEAMTVALVSADPVAVVDDGDVTHLVCCCDPDVAVCGLDVSDVSWVGHWDVPCPVCFTLEHVPCPRCGCAADCGSDVHVWEDR